MRIPIRFAIVLASMFLITLRTPALGNSGQGWIDLVIQSAKNENTDSVALALEQARQAFEKSGDLAGWIAGCKKAAKFYRDQMDDPEQAMTLFRRCLPDKNWKQPTDEKEWDETAWLFVNIAYTYNYSFEQYREAANYYERARQILVDRLGQENLDVAVYIYQELGNLYTKLGDYRAAELLLEKFRDIAVNAQEYERAAQAYNDLSVMNIARGENEKAVSVCREGLKLKNLAPFSIGLLNGNLIKAHTNLGRYAQALINVKEAEKAFKTILKDGFEPIKRRLSIIEWLKGDIYAQTGAYAEAETAFKTSRQYLLDLVPSGQARDLSRIYNSWAAMEIRRGRYDEALVLHQKALHAVITGFNPSRLTENPEPTTFHAEKTIQETLLAKSEALQARYKALNQQADLESALECHELIFEVEKLLRQAFPFESSQLEKAEESRRRSEEAISIAFELWEKTRRSEYQERALAIAERSKSVLLLEAFHRAMANNLSNLPESLLEKERELQAAIAVAEKRLFDSRSGGEAPEVLRELENKVLARRQAYTAWVSQLDQDNRRYYDLKSGYQVATLTDIRSNLTADQAFVNYFTGEEHIYVFVITADQFTCYSIRRDFPLNDWVAGFRNAIERFQMPGSDRKLLSDTYSDLGYKLYEKLLAPLQGAGLPENLLIVPSGALGFVPFDALLTAPRNDTRFMDYPYLLKKHNISYAYSGTVQHMLAQRRAGDRQFVGFAPEFSGKGGFGALSNNREVVVGARKILGGKVFRNQDATLENWKNYAPEAGFLHLSTHAQANSAEGEFSFIVFAKQEGGYDSLFVKDLYGMDLAAELVILSACETGLGKLYEGEGMISLARGFFFAGARSVITTLWQINDDANRRIMADFYQELKSGQSKSQALRNAKLAQLQAGNDPLNAHPVYWAAFAPVGSMDAVFQPVSWMIWAGAGMLMLLVVIGAYRSKRKPSAYKDGREVAAA